MSSLETIIETKGEFYGRVYNNLEALCLHREPYDVTKEMVDTVWELIQSVGSQDFRARVLFAWVLQSTKYSKSVPYASASNVFSRKKGRCVDLSFLYTAMAKVAGLDAGFVLVDRDCDDKKTNHACSYIYLDGKLVLADPAYRKFNIAHSEIVVLDDEGAYDFYTMVLPCYGKGDPDETKAQEDRIRKKYGVIFYPQCDYSECDTRYLARVNELFGYDKFSKGFFDEVLSSTLSRVLASLFWKSLRYVGLPAAITFALNYGSEFSNYADKIKSYFSGEDNITGYYAGVSIPSEENLSDLKKDNFYKLVNRLKEAHPDDLSFDLEYSKENYEIISARYFKYYEEVLSFSR